MTPEETRQWYDLNYPPEDNMRGVDVSRWQGDINWDTMFDRGIKFATLRCTVGDYYVDTMLNIYDQQTRARRIYTNYYHVMRTQATAQKQMDWYFSNQPKRADFPICLDVEWETTGDDSYYYDPEETTERVLECVEIIKERDGRTPFLYSAVGYLETWLLPHPEILALPFFVANYGVVAPNIWLFEDYKFWQFMADGDNQGEYYGSGAHGLDVDMYNGSQEEFEKEFISIVNKLKARYYIWKQRKGFYRHGRNTREIA